MTALRARDRALAELGRERARARTDALTGALNRHALEEALASEQARVGRSANPTGVLFLDADRFRDVNNSYGYATGDALLVAVYDRLRSRLRASDTVYRWGGEEFVVIAPEVGDDASLSAGAERLRRLFAEEPLQVGPHRLLVTVSIGAALLEPAWMPGDARARRITREEGQAVAEHCPRVDGGLAQEAAAG